MIIKFFLFIICGVSIFAGNFNIVFGQNIEKSGDANVDNFKYLSSCWGDLRFVTLPKNFDKKSFKEINCAYFKDKNNVYFLTQEFIQKEEYIYILSDLKILDDASPDSFEQIKWQCNKDNLYLVKDKNYIYLNENKISNINVKNIQPMNWCLIKDHQNVYKLNDNSFIKLENIVSASSFEIISSEYAKDERNVYYIGSLFYVPFDKIEILEDANPNTFEILDLNKSNITDIMAKDGNNFYYKYKNIPLISRIWIRLHYIQLIPFYNLNSFTFLLLLPVVIIIFFIIYFIKGMKNRNYVKNLNLWLKNMIIYALIFLPLFAFIIFPYEAIFSNTNVYEFEFVGRFWFYVSSFLYSIPFLILLCSVKSRKKAILFSFINILNLEFINFLFSFIGGLAA